MAYTENAFDDLLVPTILSQPQRIIDKQNIFHSTIAKSMTAAGMCKEYWLWGTIILQQYLSIRGVRWIDFLYRVLR